MRTARQISAQARALRNAKETKKSISKVKSADIAISVTKSKETAETPKTIKVVRAVDLAKGFYVDEKKSYLIVNANGYTKEQLSTELPKDDNEYSERNIKIPLDYGMGVEVVHDGEHYVFKRGGNWNKPTVTLDIMTWCGMSCGAIHYYGKLHIKLPEMTQVDAPRTLSSNFFIPMYDNDTIELTQVLEQWEIEKYPSNYEYNEAGDRHRGFYAPEGVIRRAKEVFEQVFEKGWELIIED
jgi:hypothetical protein